MEFNRANRKAIGLLVLVFALGIALGAVSHMLMDRNVLASKARGQSGSQTRLMGRLKEELNLDDDQQKQISAVLADMQHRYDAIREQMGPQFDQARNEGRDQIRQVLTPEQLPKFEDFLRRVDEEREKRAAQGGGGLRRSALIPGNPPLISFLCVPRAHPAPLVSPVRMSVHLGRSGWTA